MQQPGHAFWSTDGFCGMVIINSSIWRPSTASLAGFGIGKNRVLEIPSPAPYIRAIILCQWVHASLFRDAVMSCRRSVDPRHQTPRFFTGPRGARSALSASEGGPDVALGNAAASGAPQPPGHELLAHTG